MATGRVGVEWRCRRVPPASATGRVRKGGSPASQAGRVHIRLRLVGWRRVFGQAQPVQNRPPILHPVKRRSPAEVVFCDAGCGRAEMWMRRTRCSWAGVRRGHAAPPTFPKMFHEAPGCSGAPGRGCGRHGRGLHRRGEEATTPAPRGGGSLRRTAASAAARRRSGSPTRPAVWPTCHLHTILAVPTCRVHGCGHTKTFFFNSSRCHCAGEWVHERAILSTLSVSKYKYLLTFPDHV